MQISRKIINGPRSNNQVLVGIWVVVCVQKPSHHFLHTFSPLRMFQIVFGNSSLYLKQSPLFCLLRLSSANADHIGYVTDARTQEQPLLEAFRHLIMTQKGKRKTKVCRTSIHNKKLKVFLRALCAFPILVCSLARFDLANRGVRQSVQPHTFYA